MASIPSIPSTGPLLTPPIQPSRSLPAAPVAGGDCEPMPDVIVASDKAVVRSGLEALTRVATTPLWSADFELPAAPPPPPSAEQPWDYASTPAVTSHGAGSLRSAPLDPMTGGPGATWRWPGAETIEPEEEEEDTLFDILTFQWQLLAEGVQAGGEAVRAGVDSVAQVVATGTHAVAEAIESGLQQAVGAVGDFAANAWKSITSIRLW